MFDVWLCPEKSVFIRGGVVVLDEGARNFMDELMVLDSGEMLELPASGDVEKCRRLVVYDGVGLDDAAKVLGVSRKTVKRWSEKGMWLQERRLMESGKEECVRDALVSFAMSRELPIANMYYELQRRCVDRLRELVEADKVTPGVLDSVLEIANKGMNLAERVMKRAAPDREVGRGVGVSGVVVDDGGGNKVQVNVLQAACKSKEA